MAPTPWWPTTSPPARGRWGRPPPTTGPPGLAQAGLEQLPEASTFTAVRNLLYAVEWWCSACSPCSSGGAGHGTRGPPRGCPRRPRKPASTFGPVNSALTRYRVMATVVGVLLIVLCLVGVPLASERLGHVGIFPGTPNVFPVGSAAHDVGELITTYLGVAHGWLYMLFLITAFQLSRRERWDLPFTLVTLVCGTIPILSFWAEHRATAGPGPVGDPHPCVPARLARDDRVRARRWRCPRRGRGRHAAGAVRAARSNRT